MKFRSDVYEKLYPRPVPVKTVETAVEGFTPSVEEVKNEKVVEASPSVVEKEVETNVDGADNTTGE